MTSTAPAERAVALVREKVSARVFLLGDGEETTEALAKAIDDHGVLGSVPGALGALSKAGRRAVDQRVAAAAEGLLEDLDFSNLVVSGWCKHRALVAAARRTLATAGSEEIVDLCTHQITSTHSPHLDLFIDDVKVTSIDFEVCLTFTVKGAVALVRSGRLTAVRCGDCAVTGSLAVEGARICSREGHFQLPLLLHLGDDGLPLLKDPQVPAPRPPMDSAPTPVAADPVAAEETSRDEPAAAGVRTGASSVRAG